jgi:hypothetical protein
MDIVNGGRHCPINSNKQTLHVTYSQNSTLGETFNPKKCPTFLFGIFVRALKVK